MKAGGVLMHYDRIWDVINVMQDVDGDMETLHNMVDRVNKRVIRDESKKLKLVDLSDLLRREDLSFGERSLEVLGVTQENKNDLVALVREVLDENDLSWCDYLAVNTHKGMRAFLEGMLQSEFSYMVGDETDIDLVSSL